MDTDEGLTVADFRADCEEFGFTATSFAVLGLLGLREWSTYELAQQMQRSFSYFWPRAERRIYDEPKRLERAGYAQSRREHVGKRPRACWSITPRGRVALAHWLAEPAASAMTLEFEAMVKVFLAEQGSKNDLLVTLDAIAAEARGRHENLVAMAAEIAADGGRFPEREHINALAIDYGLQVSALTTRWAERARNVVRGWESADTPGEAARLAAHEAFVQFARD